MASQVKALAAANQDSLSSIPRTHTGHGKDYPSHPDFHKHAVDTPTVKLQMALQIKPRTGRSKTWAPGVSIAGSTGLGVAQGGLMRLFLRHTQGCEKLS